LLFGVTPGGFEKMFAERQGVDADTNQKLMAKSTTCKSWGRLFGRLPIECSPGAASVGALLQHVPAHSRW
jgi:hypothetical protein